MVVDCVSVFEREREMEEGDREREQRRRAKRQREAHEPYAEHLPKTTPFSVASTRRTPYAP